jgi:O-antigen/teichoic acid export membrane protein
MRNNSGIALGVTMNWVALVANGLVSFFLTPFVVHRLGNAWYGVWILINSAIAYMATLDLGLRGAVVHFIAKHHAQGDHEASSHTLSAALVIRILMSSLVTVATVLLALFLGRILRIPPELEGAARPALLATGISFAFTLTSGVFGAVLAALQRFDVLAGISMAQSFATALGAVWLLDRGYGIVALAILQLAIALVSTVGLVVLAFAVYPELRIRLTRPSGEMIRKLWNYSFYLFVISIAGQVIYYTDNLVVGAFLSAGAVTFFAIAGRLIEYHRQPGAALAQTLMPVASSLDVRGDPAGMLRLLVQGTRVSMLVCWPIEIVLFIRAETFIGLWIGPQYAQISAAILRILLLSNFFIGGNQVSANLTFGTGKHKAFAIWQSAEAVANLVLSIILVRRMGITGVAWGTAIPSFVTQAVLWPVYICRVVKCDLRGYLWQAWGKTAIAMIPFTAGCLWTERHLAPAHISSLFLQVAALLPVLFAAAGIVFWQDVRKEWQIRMAGRRYRRESAAKETVKAAFEAE